jgi:periplasmic divalent cation tolerance protein
MNEILVLSTVDSLESAQAISTALVEKHEAACVSIVSGIHSVYRWQGKVTADKEFLLLIKSSTEKFEAIRSTIRSMHSYETPEVIALPISAGDGKYLDWLRQQVSPEAEN